MSVANEPQADPESGKFRQTIASLPARGVYQPRWARVARAVLSTTIYGWNDRRMKSTKLGSWVCGGFVALALVGCKDQAKCDDALKTARQAMQDQFLDMELARKWRDFAGKVCGVGPELTALDKEIVDREAALTKAADDKAKADEAAGRQAIDAAGQAFADFDKLEEKERTLPELKKAKSRARKLLLNLAPAYVDQVQKYIDQQFDKRQGTLKKD